MSILSDADIRAALEAGDMEIEPFSEGALTPNGYDLSIAELLLPDSGERFLEGVARVPPMSRFLVSTRERVRLGPALSAQLWLRTTWARRGVLASFGRIDAGFDGTLTFGALNASAEPLEVPIDETFAQLVVESMTGMAEALYGERSGHYQDQRGVTLAVPPGGKMEMGGEMEMEGTGRAPELDAPCLENDCHECCLETEMPLSRADIVRLEALGHDPGEFSIEEEGFAFLANRDGRCHFLDDEGRCTEYAHRPDGCRLYPLVLDADMSEFQLDYLCPNRVSVHPGEVHRQALLELLDRLARERGKVPADRMGKL